MKRIVGLLFGIWLVMGSSAQDKDWYFTHKTGEPNQTKFQPAQRLSYTLKNTLDVERKNHPVIISRDDFPMPDLHEMWITIVDPSLPSYEGPDKEVLAVYGGHQLLAEVHGHAIFHQLDDLDKDGIWDELFFQTDHKPFSPITLCRHSVRS